MKISTRANSKTRGFGECLRDQVLFRVTEIVSTVIFESEE